MISDFFRRKGRHAAEALMGIAPHVAGKRFDRDRRIRQYAETPRSPLAHQHVRNCRVLPDRFALLSELPKGATVAEIGVAYGEFSRAILDRSKPKSLHLIDLWKGERYEAGLVQIKADLSNEIESKVVAIDRGLSTEKLAEFPDHYFDWVYIDTDHSFPTTFAELCLCSRKVKPDGIIAGHDFCSGNVIKPIVYGVVQACNKFCVEFGYEYAFVTLDEGTHFSFALRKIADPTS